MNLPALRHRPQREIGSKAIRNIEEGDRIVIEEALRQPTATKAKAAKHWAFHPHALTASSTNLSLPG